MNTQTEKALLAAYVVRAAEGRAGIGRCDECIAAFGRSGLPRPGDEAWRHMPVEAVFGTLRRIEPGVPPAEASGDPAGAWERALTGGIGQPAADGGIVQDESDGCDGCGTEGVYLALHDGASDGRLYGTSQGTRWGSLRAAADECAAIFDAHGGSAADWRGDALSALAGAFAGDGAFVWVPDGVRESRTVRVDAVYDPAEAGTGRAARMLVVVGRGARVELDLLRRQSAEGTVWAAEVCEFVLGEGAELVVHETEAMRGGGTLLATSWVRQAGNSRLRIVAGLLGSGICRSDYRIALTGPRAEAELRGLYIAGGDEHREIALNVRHEAPDCRSYELVKGIAGGGATGAFGGRVYVAPGAQRTEALQQNRNLVLDRASRIWAEPQLEIYADDVRCSHGATVGQLDEEAVYYMRQRGLSEAEARALQMNGFTDDVLGHCNSLPLCRFMRTRAARKIVRLGAEKE